MNILNPHDWDELERQFKSASPFPSICIDNFLDQDFADQLAASYPDYESARKIGREHSNVNEKLKVQITDPALFPSPVATLCEGLGSADFISKLSRMSGIDDLSWDPKFTGGGMHMTGNTGLLDVHVDFNYDKKLNLYRRLNILIYLNPVWEPEWGGDVELWDKDVKHCIQSFEPRHNRCVIFATSDYSFHGVVPVTCPPGYTRNSLAAYYYSEEAGDNAGDAWGGLHSTIFRARPDETGKKYFGMPLHRLKMRTRSLANKIKSSMKKVTGN